jgi:hypothetical protein
LKGYGKFGPNTSAAWTKYKTEYLKQNPNLSQEAKKITSTTQAAATQTQQQGAAPQTAQTGVGLTSGQQLANATPKNTNLNLAASITPKQYYTNLTGQGFIKGEEGNRRLKYTGPALNQEQQNLLTKAMDEMGYEFARKGNNNKLVYKRKPNQATGQENVQTQTSDTDVAALPTGEEGETNTAIDKDDF